MSFWGRMPTRAPSRARSAPAGVRSPEDVVVYIQEVPGEHRPPAEPAVVDQKKLVFVPHVLAIVKGTTVTFRNGDPLLHNVMWPASDDGSYPAKNLGTWGQNDSRSFTFDKMGHVVLLCNIHAEMEGHVVVLQNPFFAITGKDGLYEIKNVPPGRVHGYHVVPAAEEAQVQIGEGDRSGRQDGETGFLARPPVRAAARAGDVSRAIGRQDAMKLFKLQTTRGHQWFHDNISCHAACPVGTEAFAYVAALAERDHEAAYAIARRPNPFPYVCGRVCAIPARRRAAAVRSTSPFPSGP